MQKNPIQCNGIVFAHMFRAIFLEGFFVCVWGGTFGDRGIDPKTNVGQDVSDKNKQTKNPKQEKKQAHRHMYHR